MEYDNKREVLTDLLENIKQRNPLIIVGLPELGDLVSLHSERLGTACETETRAPETYRYWHSIKHCGWGVFEGNTEHGKFTFCGGGAMSTKRFEDGSWVGYSNIGGNEEVIKDLDYPWEEVEEALGQALKNCN